MAVTNDYLQYVLEQLHGFGQVTSRRMFGGIGLRPFPDKPYSSMTYYEVPADTLEDADECVAWAQKSVSIAAVSPQRAARRGTKRRKVR